MRVAVRRVLAGLHRAFVWTAPLVAVSVIIAVVLEATETANVLSRVWVWIGMALYGALWGLVEALRAVLVLTDPAERTSAAARSAVAMGTK